MVKNKTRTSRQPERQGLPNPTKGLPMPRLRLPIPAAPRLPSAAETLGRPPLIAGEARAGYETMLARVTEAVRPDGILEEAWVRDVVDLIWDAVRLRRLEAALMTVTADHALDDVLGNT